MKNNNQSRQQQQRQPQQAPHVSSSSSSDDDGAQRSGTNRSNSGTNRSNSGSTATTPVTRPPPPPRGSSAPVAAPSTASAAGSATTPVASAPRANSAASTATTTTTTANRGPSRRSNAGAAAAPPLTFRDAMVRANPAGSVDTIVRYRPLLADETQSAAKLVVFPPERSGAAATASSAPPSRGPSEERAASAASAASTTSAPSASAAATTTTQRFDVDSVTFGSFTRVFLPEHTKASDDVSFALRALNDAHDRGCNSVAVVAGGAHLGGKTHFTTSVMRAFIKSVFGGSAGTFFSLSVGAVQVFNGSVYDLLRVSLEYPKGFFVDSATGARGRELRAANESDALQILEKATTARESALHHTKHISARSSAVYCVSYRRPSAVHPTRFFFVDLAGCDRDTPFLNEDVLKQQKSAAESLSALMRTISFWSQQRDRKSAVLAGNGAAVNETIARDARDPLVQLLPFFEDPTLHVTFATCVSRAAQHALESRSALELGDELAFFTTNAAAEFHAQQQLVAAQQQQQPSQGAGGRDSSPDAAAPVSPPQQLLLPRFDIWAKQQTRRSVSLAQAGEDGASAAPSGRRPASVGGAATTPADVAAAGAAPAASAAQPAEIAAAAVNADAAALEQIEALRIQLRASQEELRKYKSRGANDGDDDDKTPKMSDSDATPTNMDASVLRGQSFPVKTSNNNRGRGAVEMRDFQIQVVPTHVMVDDHGASLDRSIEFAIEDVYDQLMRIPSLARGKGGAAAASVPATALDLLQMQEAENRLKIKAQSFETLSGKIVLFATGDVAAAAAAAKSKKQKQQQQSREPAAESSDVQASAAVDDIFDEQADFMQAGGEEESQPGLATFDAVVPNSARSSTGGGIAPSASSRGKQPAMLARDPMPPRGASVPLDDFRRANSAAFMEAYRQKRLAGTGYYAAAAAVAAASNSGPTNSQNTAAPPERSTRSMSVSQAGASYMAAPEELQNAMSQRDRALDREAEALKMASSRTVAAERDVAEANAARRDAEERAQRVQKELNDKIAALERRLEEVQEQQESTERALQRDLREARDRADRLQELADEEKGKKDSLTTRAAKYSEEAQDRISALEDDVARLQEERDVALRQRDTETSDLKRQVDRLEAELDIVASDRDATRRLADAKAARTIAEKVEALENELQNERQKHEAASSRASKISKDAGDKIAALERQLTETMAERDAREHDAEKLRRELEEKVDRLEGQNRAATAARDTATARYDRLSKDSAERIAALQAELDRANATRESALDSISQSKRDSVDQAQALSAELDRERAERTELAARVQKLSNENAARTRALEDELARTAQERDDALAGTAAKVSKALAERTKILQQELAVVTQQRDGALQRLAEQSNDLNGRLQRADAELLDTRSQLDKLEDESKKATRDLQSRVKRLESELADVTEDRDNAQTELARLSKDSAERIARLEEEKADAQAARANDAAAAAKAKKEADTKIAVLESEVAELERSCENAEILGAKSARELNRKNAELQATLDEKAAEAAALREELRKASQETMAKFRRLDGELQEAQSQRDEAMAESRRVQDKLEKSMMMQGGGIGAASMIGAERSSRQRSIPFPVGAAAGASNSEAEFFADTAQPPMSSAASTALKQMQEARDAALAERRALEDKLERQQRNSASEVAELKKHLRSAEQDNEKLAQREQETAKQLREARAAYRNLEQEVEKTKIDSVLQQRVLETEKGSAERRLSAELEQCRKRIADLEALTEQQEAESSAAQEAVATFSEQLESSMQHANQMEGERDALQRRLDDITAKFEEHAAAHRAEAEKARTEAEQERARAKDLAEALEQDRKGFEEHRERELLELSRESVGQRGEKAQLQQSLAERDAEVDALRHQLEAARAAAEAATRELQDEKVTNAAKRAELVKLSTAAQQRAANSRQIEAEIVAAHMCEKVEILKAAILAESCADLGEAQLEETMELLLDLDARHSQLRAEYDNAMMLSEASAAQLRAHATKMEEERDDAVKKLDDFLKQYDDELSNAIQEATVRLQQAQKAQTAATGKAAEAMTRAQRMVEEAEKDRQDVLVVARKQLAVSQHISDVMADEADGRRTITLAWVSGAGSLYSDWWHLVESKLWEWLTEASTALHQAETDYESVSTERDNLRNQLRHQTERADCAEDDRDRYLKQLRSAEMTVDQLQQDKDQLQAAFGRNIKQLQDEHAGYEALTTAQRDRLQRAEDEAAALGKQLEQTRRAEVERDNEIHQLRRNVRAANAEITKAAGEAEAMRAKLKTVDTARREAHARVQELTNTVADLRDSNYRLSQRAEGAAAEAQTEKQRGMRDAAQVQNLLAEIEELQRGYASARRELIILAQTVGLREMGDKEFATLPPGIIQIRAATQKLLQRVADAESQLRSRDLAAIKATTPSSVDQTPTSATPGDDANAANAQGKKRSGGGGVAGGVDPQLLRERDAEIARLQQLIEKLRAGEHGRVAELQRAVMMLRDQLEQQQDEDSTIARLKARIEELEHFISTTTTQNAEKDLAPSPFAGRSLNSKSSRNAANNNHSEQDDAFAASSNTSGAVSALRIELEDTRAQLNRAEADRQALVEKHQRELKKVQVELKVTRDELIASQTQLALMRTQLNEQRSANMQSDDDRTRKVAEMERELEELNDRVLVLEQEKASLEQHNAELTERVAAASGTQQRSLPAFLASSQGSVSADAIEISGRTEASPAARRPDSAAAARHNADANELIANLQKENAQLMRMNDGLQQQVNDLSEAALTNSMGGVAGGAGTGRSSNGSGSGRHGSK